MSMPNPEPLSELISPLYGVTRKLQLNKRSNHGDFYGTFYLDVTGQQ
jgi:hypothetical protein